MLFVRRCRRGTCPTGPLLVVDHLQHQLRDRQRGERFTVTLDQRLEIWPGAFAAILGPSGCGKTTLLTVLGLLRRPSDPEHIGRFEIAGRNRHGDREVHDVKYLWQRNRQRRIERLRRRFIGFALQSGELLPSLTVSENIAVPLRLNGFGGRRCRARVGQLLASFELGTRRVAESDSLARGDAQGAPSMRGSLAHARINKLSGGEYQRVVLARAIAHRPRIAFVDEPTSSLNRELARAALVCLKQTLLEGDDPGAIVMITHDEQLAAEFAEVLIRMEPEKHRPAGRVVEIVQIRPAAQTNRQPQVTRDP